MAGNVKSFVMRGLRWGFRRRPLSIDDWGYCTDRTQKGRHIAIDEKATGRMELDVTIHELLHAAYPDLNEQAVTEAATDIASVLWRLGYRRQPSREGSDSPESRDPSAPEARTCVQ